MVNLKKKFKTHYWKISSFSCVNGFNSSLFQAGIIEEMLEDTFDSLEDEDMEEEAQEEVDKILFEVTQGLGNIPYYYPEIMP